MVETTAGDAALRDPVQTFWQGRPPVETLRSLRDDIEAAITQNGGRAPRDDSELGNVIARCIEAVTANPGQPLAAADEVASPLWRLGGLAAAAGADATDIDAAFDIVERRFTSYLPRFTARQLRRAFPVRRIHADVRSFLDHCKLHVHRGREDEHTITVMTQSEAQQVLRGRIFTRNSASARDIARLAEAAGLDPLGVVVPIVRLGAQLPRIPRVNYQTLVSRDGREALCWRPESATAPFFDGGFNDPLVVGAPVSVPLARTSLLLARKTAHLIARGQIEAAGTVHCTNLLGQLATAPDQLTIELVVEKHLGPFAALSAQRRVSLGEALLAWLETGKSIRAVARDLNVQEQTMYNRIAVAKEMLSGPTDDPNLRMELAIALRHILPTWRASARAVGSPPRPRRSGA